MIHTFSLIVPNFNGEKYIRETLNSIDKFGVGFNEIIIVDGGSSDGSLTAIGGFLIKGPPGQTRRLINQKSRGLYSGWNEGVAEAKGMWLMILASDDVLLCAPHLEIVKGIDVDVVCFGLRVINDSGDDISDSYLKNVPGFFLQKQLWGRQLDGSDALARAMSFAHSPATCFSQLLVRQSVFQRHGFFAIDRSAFGDFFWQWRILPQVRLLFSSFSHVAWRIHTSSATSRSRAADVFEFKIIEIADSPSLYRCQFREAIMVDLLQYLRICFKRIAFPKISLVVKALRVCSLRPRLIPRLVLCDSVSLRKNLAVEAILCESK